MQPHAYTVPLTWVKVYNPFSFEVDVVCGYVRTYVCTMESLKKEVWVK